MSIMLVAMLLMSPTAPAEQRALTYPELQDLLRDAWIFDPDVPDGKSYLDRPEWFFPNGEYERHDDNFEARGSYRFIHNQVCVIVEAEAEVCRSVFVNPSGQLWMSRPRAEQLRRITVQKIAYSPKGGN